MIKAELKNDIIAIKKDDKSILTISIDRNPDAVQIVTALQGVGAIELDMVQREYKSQMQKYRESKGLTHEQLGDMVGCSRQTIVKIENQTSVPKLPLALKIADALNMDVRELV